VDEGIDTGDIIVQEAHPIGDEDDYSTLLERAHAECASILYRAIGLVRRGEVRARRQSEIHPVGFYCGMRGEGDEKLDWNQTSREVFNFVRAICRPGPMARSTVRGHEIRINRARLIPGAPVYKCVPGMVVGRTKETLVVKTLDSTVELTEYECDERPRIGDRLK
jgi:methionyl-tRNA formyltransferase